MPETIDHSRSKSSVYSAKYLSCLNADWNVVNLMKQSVEQIDLNF